MKNSKSQKVNMFFSAFLMCAFLVCSYFITDYAQNILGEIAREAVMTIIFVVFGLFLFYATRVGDGKPVYRFSFSVLIFMILPSLYLILCNFITALPLADIILKNVSGRYTLLIAEVIFGYGLPYLFLSGFELKEEEEEEEEEETEDLPEALENTENSENTEAPEESDADENILKSYDENVSEDIEKSETDEVSEK